MGPLCCFNSDENILSMPELFLWKFFGNVFSNGQGVPNSHIAVDQHRYFANRVQVFQGLFEFGLRIKTIKAHHHFFVGDACLFEQNPRSHGP